MTHEKGLQQIKEILTLMDENENNKGNNKNKEKLMQLIYEVL